MATKRMSFGLSRGARKGGLYFSGGGNIEAAPVSRSRPSAQLRAPADRTLSHTGRNADRAAMEVMGGPRGVLMRV